MNRPSLRLLAAASVAAVAAVVATLVPAGAATAAEPDPLLGAPKAGSCYDLTGKAASDKNSLTVSSFSCTKKHTLWVAGVAELPEGTAVDLENEKTAALVSKLCAPVYAKLIGDYGSIAYANSAYVGYRFVPTAAQQRQGARWASCAIGIANGDDRLVSSTQKKPVKVAASLPDKLSLCGTRTYGFTNCAAPHAFRPVHAQPVKFKGAYSNTKRDRLAVRVCRRHANGNPTFMWASRGITAHRYVLVCLNQNRR